MGPRSPNLESVVGPEGWGFERASKGGFEGVASKGEASKGEASKGRAALVGLCFEPLLLPPKQMSL